MLLLTSSMYPNVILWKFMNWVSLSHLCVMKMTYHSMWPSTIFHCTLNVFLRIELTLYFPLYPPTAASTLWTFDGWFYQIPREERRKSCYQFCNLISISLTSHLKKQCYFFFSSSHLVYQFHEFIWIIYLVWPLYYCVKNTRKIFQNVFVTVPNRCS